MEEVTNLSQEEAVDISKNFPVQPRRNKLIITVNVDEYDGDVVLSNNSFSETQYVVAVGDFVKDIKVGDPVLLDLEKMMVSEQSPDNQYESVSRIKLKPVDVNGRMYALINDGVVDAIDNRN
tara:strand:+ start:7140 stop:7505 length:366 start_codon:yes stop_codon:yes gene_type:complete